MSVKLTSYLRSVATLCALSLLTATESIAQQSSATPRASFGIRIACDCTVNSNPSLERPWVFRSPISVTAVQRQGPAEGILMVGDQITHAGGIAITSTAGARLLANARAGERVALRVRRDGRDVDLFVTAISAPANDPHVIGARAPSAIASTAPSPSRSATPSAFVPRPPDLESEGWLGFALACTNCGWARERGDDSTYWESSAPPRLYAIQPGGPAALARLAVGDVLTHVNGIAITERAAGRALGGVRPSQTLRLTIERNGATREVDVTAAARPAVAPSVEERAVGRIGGVEVLLSGSGDAIVAVDTLRGEMTIRIGEKVVTLRDTRVTPRAEGRNRSP